MNKADLFEMIRSGEYSTLEFRRDDVPNHELAKALTTFLNLEGGTVLLGVRLWKRASEADPARAGSGT